VFARDSRAVLTPTKQGQHLGLGHPVTLHLATSLPELGFPFDIGNGQYSVMPRSDVMRARKRLNRDIFDGSHKITFATLARSLQACRRAGLSHGAAFCQDPGLPQSDPQEAFMTTQTAMTPLRQRMLDDMKLRNMAVSTRKIYVASVANFSAYHGSVALSGGP
jgi:hypothetical protein